MNIHGMSGKKIIKTLGLATTLFLAANYTTVKVSNRLYGGNVKSVPEVIYDNGKKMYEDYQERVETEKAIEAEGIQAKSYTEAKMKLDSINFERTCNELGVPVPKLPENASKNDLIIYNLEKMAINEKAAERNLEKIQEAIKNMDAKKIL